MNSTFTFNTLLGPISLTTDDGGVCRLEMHGSSTRAAGPVPDRWQELAGRIQAHLSGDLHGFEDVPISWHPGSQFARQVYTSLRQVPAGQVVSYGQLASLVGKPGGARAVSRAMATNKVPLIIPCHRVVGANGSLTGFSGGDGMKTKAQMLVGEGVLPRFPASGSPFDSVFEPYAWQAGVQHLLGVPAFETLHEKVGPTALPRAHPGNPFGALVEIICHQQLAGAAALSIFHKVKGTVGKLAPDAVSKAGLTNLRSAGLSASKAGTILELAHRWEDHPDLLNIRGIGPWTVQMFQMFHLGRPDVFAPSDLGIRKAVSMLTGASHLLSPKDTEKAGRRFKPFSTIAMWYLWRSLGAVTLGE